MKLEPSDKHNRTRIATGLRQYDPRHPETLEIAINYTGASTCANAIPLDRDVIPRIVQAVNSFDDLLAALAECVTDDPGSACFNTGKKTRRLMAISDIARAAIAKATGKAVA